MRMQPPAGDLAVEHPRSRGTSRPRLAFALLALAALGCAVWGFFIEPARLVVRERSLEVPGLSPMRVAVLSDLHAGSSFIDARKIRRIVEEMNAGKPDLVLLLGDYLIGGKWGGQVVGGHKMPPDSFAPILGRLRAPLGVFAVLGNHDWWTDGPGTRRALEAAGIRVLDDELATIHAPGGSFGLAGLADAMEGHPDPARVLAAATPGMPVLAFTHNPDLFPRIPASVALTVAGHTHGGQVRLPLAGPPIIPSRHGQRYAAGLIDESGHLLFVTTGVGTSILPVRFGVPPEIVFLDIRPAGP